MKRLSFHIILFVIAGLFFSCKPTIPSKYIQPDEFEDILYERYIAQSMANNSETSDDIEYNNRLYWLGVLKKHNVTEAEFDSSMVYYTRHSNMIYDMYKNMSERLKDEALALGAETSDINRFGEAAAGDTANIWEGERNLLLMHYAPYNSVSYSIKADSAFHKGDKLILSFNTNFIIQDGFRDGTAMLAVQFANDSITSRTIHISSDTHYNVEITDNDNLGIKEVKGFIYLPQSKDATSSTLRLLFIDNISLVRMHIKQKEEETDTIESPSDSIKAEKKDSLVMMSPEPEKDSKKWTKKADSKDMPLTR